MSAVSRRPLPPTTLAEQFWSVARGMEEEDAVASDPQAVVRHVLAVLDAFEGGEVGQGVTAHTRSFLVLLRQQEAKGDLLYASPEQARGEEIDERSLVFSVGVLLFERLTGRHPFGAEENPQRVARIRRAELASGVNYFPKVPAELRNILLRSMGPFPEERYADLDEMRQALEGYCARARRRMRTPAPLPGMDPERKNRRARSLRFAPPEVRTENEGDALSPEPGELSARRPRRLAPLLWMGAGAAVASVLFLVISSAGDVPAAGTPRTAAGLGPQVSALEEVDGETGSESESESESQRAETEVETKAVAETEAGTESESESESETATESESEGRAGAAPSAAPSTFSPSFAGRQALEEARPCFSKTRLAEGVQVGATMVFVAGAATSQRVFFGAGVKPDEQRCLAEALVGLSAGQPPPGRTLIQYDLMLTAAGGSFESRAKP